MPERKFLYISPYFPPQSRVGALRPLKFVKHLLDHHWLPVVLADLSSSDEIDPELEKAIPSKVEVVRNYSSHAGKAESKYYFDRKTNGRNDRRSKARLVKKKKINPSALWSNFVQFLPNDSPFGPEFIPLGSHSLNILHAIKASRELLRRGNYKAILVNADPYASLLVGAQISREFNLPLALDLRDPWTVCDVRRKLRFWPQRKINDLLERRVVETASKVILNTDKAMDAYRHHYRDLPADHFTVIRNHGDVELSCSGQFPLPGVFTMLYFGSFRRFVEGTQLLMALAELRRRGYDGTQVQLLVTGNIWGCTKKLIENMDIKDMIVDHPFVSYTQVGSFMRTMDMLISVSSKSIQRIPSKFFDYAVSDRPILSISDNPELEKIVSSQHMSGITFSSLNDVNAIADAMETAIAGGRRRTIDRGAINLDSVTASAMLARVLDEISA